jgi:hypothetical protein
MLILRVVLVIRTVWKWAVTDVSGAHAVLVFWIED